MNDYEPSMAEQKEKFAYQTLHEMESLAKLLATDFHEYGISDTIMKAVAKVNKFIDKKSEEEPIDLAF